MTTARRFYKSVEIIETETGFGVGLDGRQPNTPAGQPIQVPARALAELLALEWDQQTDTIDPKSMPLTRLANVAIDRTPNHRDAMAEEFVRYCTTDLLCHLADAPQELVRRQEASWFPVREWAGETHGVALNAVAGIIATEQPESSLKAARAYASRLGEFRLTGLAWGVPLFGSALLGMAVEQARLSAEDAFDLSRIDETWQAEKWGEDDEAAEAAERRRQDAVGLGRWFAALPSED